MNINFSRHWWKGGEVDIALIKGGKGEEVEKSASKGRELECRNKSITLDKTLLTNIFFSDILRKTF